MVWEQQTYGVVMLNKCVERGMVSDFRQNQTSIPNHLSLPQSKCSPYWPQYDDQPVTFGQFQLEALMYEEESSYILTHLKLQNLEVCFLDTCFMFPWRPKALKHVTQAVSAPWLNHLGCTSIG